MFAGLGSCGNLATPLPLFEQLVPAPQGWMTDLVCIPKEMTRLALSIHYLYHSVWAMCAPRYERLLVFSMDDAP